MVENYSLDITTLDDSKDPNQCQSIIWTNKHGIKTQQKKLGQLERLRSEDTPRCLMITHTTESYWIPSHENTKSKLHIQRICQNYKFLNFETNFTRDTPSEVAW